LQIRLAVGTNRMSSSREQAAAAAAAVYAWPCGTWGNVIRSDAPVRLLHMHEQMMTVLG
jgi:hypothetical protein